MNKLKNKEFFYHTSRGTLYNLTRENQQNLNINFVMFQISDLIRLKEVFEKLPKNMSFKKYYGFEDKQIVLTSIDYNKKRNRGCQDKNSIEIDDFGYIKLSNKNYLEFAKLIQPDILVSLTEEGREGTFQKSKSSKRNIEKSLKFLNETIQYKKKNDQKWKIYAAFQGSFFEDQRQQNLTQIEKLKDDIDGIICYGLYHEIHRNENLHKNEDIYSFYQRQKVYNVIKTAQNCLNIVLSSDGNYLKILECLYYNFNQFETQFPFQLAKKGQASQFNNKLWLQYTNHYVENNYEVFDEQIKRLFSQNNKLLTLNLNDEKFARDLQPLDSKCDCLACQKYSRAYINHLLKHKEMTGNVLLTIHNTHQHQLFLQQIQKQDFEQYKNKYILAFWFLFTDQKITS